MRLARQLLHFAALGALLFAAERVGIARRPLALPFGFGLLHGLGFASALGSPGVPAREIPLALAPAYAIGSLGMDWCLDRVAGAF